VSISHLPSSKTNKCFGRLSTDAPDIPSLREEFGDILSSAVELSHTRAANILSVRVDEHTQLDLPEFLRLFNESWNFVVRCEVICKRMIVGLRGVVVSQVGSQSLDQFNQ
jgi:vacuolar protein sorting-associated protein 54